MATNTTLALTSSDGTAFSVDANEVIYAYDDSNSKAIFTYKISIGVNAAPVTLSISTATLQALSTNILFIETVIEADGNTKVVCFNNNNVIKLVTAPSSTCTMNYYVNSNEVNQSFLLNDTAANISTACKTTIPVTDDTTQTIYYINGFRVFNITSATETGTILSSAVVVAAGTAQVVGDILPLTGGTYTTQANVVVATTKPVSLATNAAGTDYVPNDTILTAGGTASPHSTLTVTNTKVVSATVAAGGSGGTNGTQTVTGTTGTGTKFQASVTVSGNAITAVLSITVAGNYTVNPTSITNEPVTGASLTGAQLSVVMGVLTAGITTAGSYTVNSATFTQTSTSGSGTGATFNTVVYGVNTVTVGTAGAYTAPPTNPVSQGTSSGSGIGATFTATFGSGGISGSSIAYNDEQSPVYAELAVEETKAQVTTLINAL